VSGHILIWSHLWNRESQHYINSLDKSNYECHMYGAYSRTADICILGPKNLKERTVIYSTTHPKQPQKRADPLAPHRARRNQSNPSFYACTLFHATQAHNLTKSSPKTWTPHKPITSPHLNPHKAAQALWIRGALCVDQKLLWSNISSWHPLRTPRPTNSPSTSVSTYVCVSNKQSIADRTISNKSERIEISMPV
jgi:hypothetical protein